MLNKYDKGKFKRKNFEPVIIELTNMLDKSSLENSERMLRSFYRTIEPYNRRFWENPERISWEIFADKDKIGFYVWIPKRIERLIRSRILDAYPQVEIKEVNNDYVDRFKKPYVAKMDLLKHYMFATNLKASDTSLSSILNSMSRLEKDEIMMLQISMLPINNKWQGKAYGKYRELLFSGKKPAKYKPFSIARGLTYSAKGIFYLVETIAGVFIDMGKDENKNTPIEKEELKGTQKKISLPAFNTSIRLAVESPSKNSMSTRLAELSNAFIELDGDNEWRRKELRTKNALEEIKERKIDKNTNNIVTTNELSPIVRLNNKDIIVPELNKKIMKTLPIPKGLEEGLYFATGLHNEKRVDIYLDDKKHIDDFVHPMTITGAMGAGKTTLIINLALARALAGYGVIILDTQGDLSKDFIKMLPKKELNRVDWLNFGDLNFPVALDLLEFVSLGKSGDKSGAEFVKDWAKDELIEIMRRLWGQNFGPQTEYITRHNITTVIETGGSFVEMFRMLVDDQFREETIARIKFKAPLTWAFWRNFQDNYSMPQKMKMLMPSINKIGSFIDKRAVRNIISQGKQKYNFRDMMDNSRIVVVTIPKGQLIGTWQLIASLIVSKIWLASLSRNNIPIDKRKPAFLFADEYEDLVSDNFGIMLSQSRKYRLGLVFGFQYLDQIKQKNRSVYNAIVGNRPHMVAMKIGPKDSEVYAEIFKDYYSKEELQNFPNLHGIAMLNINGQPSQPFTIRVPYNYFTKDDTPRATTNDSMIFAQERGRKNFARPREEVEKEVATRYSDILKTMELVEEGDVLEEDIEVSEDLLKELQSNGFI